MQNKGFTLIELMIAVTIVGILASIAYPSYQSHVLKTRRKAAEGCLMELAQWMERYYTTNMTYAGASLPTTSCRTDLGSYYTFSFDGTPAATAFTLKAEAQGAQANDTSCTSLTVDHIGQKTPSGCW
ncbi:type IV pilin protein [Allochromatium tepidum]|uniref:Type IV minor pilin protein PilE n=1 Tax=Allochromatium tepidum TaxID=553982 RepID=A0ABN6GDJ6_9GAMM|nr:type IV pilin protein [Allochromatium tepidum]BCU07714.1 type IV minor pilin protein PilE [Allochromatium tepidum]